MSLPHSLSWTWVGRCRLVYEFWRPDFLLLIWAVHSTFRVRHYTVLLGSCKENKQLRVITQSHEALFKFSKILMWCLKADETWKTKNNLEHCRPHRLAWLKRNQKWLARAEHVQSKHQRADHKTIKGQSSRNFDLILAAFRFESPV